MAELKTFPVDDSYRLGDTVELAGITYRIESSYLSSQSKGWGNSGIFTRLDIKNPLEHVHGIVGYIPEDGDFPEIKFSDIGKVINNLYYMAVNKGVQIHKNVVTVTKQGNQTIFTVNGRRLVIEGTPLYFIKEKK